MGIVFLSTQKDIVAKIHEHMRRWQHRQGEAELIAATGLICAMKGQLIALCFQLRPNSGGHDIGLAALARVKRGCRDMSGECDAGHLRAVPHAGG